MGRQHTVKPLTDAQRDLCAAHVELAYRIAKVVYRHTHRSGEAVRFEDVMSAAQLGLIRACRRFNPDAGVKFETYANLCIRGEIKQAFRDACPLSRTDRQRGVAMPEIHSVDTKLPGSADWGVKHAKDLLEDHREPHGFKEQQRDAVRYLVRGLSERERFIFERYYVDDRTMKQIGAEMGLSESRISQAHSTALCHLADANNPAA